TSSVCRCVPVFSNTRLSVVRAVPDAAVLYELGAPLGSISPCAAPIAQAGKGALVCWNSPPPPLVVWAVCDGTAPNNCQPFLFLAHSRAQVFCWRHQFAISTPRANQTFGCARACRMKS